MAMPTLDPHFGERINPIIATCRHRVSVTVEIPAALRRHAGGQSRIRLPPAGTVSETLHMLVERYPTLGPQIFAGNGQVFGFVGVFLNTEDIRRLNGMQTPLSGDDVITVVPAIAGG
jgi:molybdopterin synthase sulfur carrier subunit